MNIVLYWYFFFFCSFWWSSRPPTMLSSCPSWSDMACWRHEGGRKVLLLLFLDCAACFLKKMRWNMQDIDVVWCDEITGICKNALFSLGYSTTVSSCNHYRVVFIVIMFWSYWVKLVLCQQLRCKCLSSTSKLNIPHLHLSATLMSEVVTDKTKEWTHLLVSFLRLLLLLKLL